MGLYDNHINFLEEKVTPAVADEKYFNHVLISP